MAMSSPRARVCCVLYFLHIPLCALYSELHKLMCVCSGKTDLINYAIALFFSLHRKLRQFIYRKSAKHIACTAKKDSLLLSSAQLCKPQCLCTMHFIFSNGFLRFFHRHRMCYIIFDAREKNKTLTFIIAHKNVNNLFLFSQF